MAVSRQVRGILYLAAATDIALGLLFLAYGAALFGLDGTISLVIGLVLIAGGIGLVGFAMLHGRSDPPTRGGE